MTDLKLAIDWRRGDFHLQVQETLAGSGVTALFGPSGCGKTSLLRAIAGLETPSGNIRLGDDVWLDDKTRLPAHRRGLAMVFQGEQLLPHLSVADNLHFAYRHRWRDNGDTPDTLQQWLGLQDLAGRRPEELSGGEKQRAALACALARAPRWLLLDEPLTGLDEAARDQLMTVLEDTVHRAGCPVLLVSHQWPEIARLAHTVLMMQAGRVVTRGDVVELSADPHSPISRGRDAGALLQATVAEHHNNDHLSRVTLAQGIPLWVGLLRYPVGTRVRLQVPARDVSLTLKPSKTSSIMNILETDILAIEDIGQGQAMVQLSLSGQRLLARITRRSAERLKLETGMRVYAQIKSVALLSDRASA